MKNIYVIIIIMLSYKFYVFFIVLVSLFIMMIYLDKLRNKSLRDNFANLFTYTPQLCSCADGSESSVFNTNFIPVLNTNFTFNDFMNSEMYILINIHPSTTMNVIGLETTQDIKLYSNVNPITGSIVTTKSPIYLLKTNDKKCLIYYKHTQSTLRFLKFNTVSKTIQWIDVRSVSQNWISDEYFWLIHKNFVLRPKNDMKYSLIFSDTNRFSIVDTGKCMFTDTDDVEQVNALYKFRVYKCVKSGNDVWFGKISFGNVALYPGDLTLPDLLETYTYTYIYLDTKRFCINLVRNVATAFFTFEILCSFAISSTGSYTSIPFVKHDGSIKLFKLQVNTNGSIAFFTTNNVAIAVDSLLMLETLSIIGPCNVHSSSSDYISPITISNFITDEDVYILTTDIGNTFKSVLNSVTAKDVYVYSNDTNSKTGNEVTFKYLKLKKITSDQTIIIYYETFGKKNLLTYNGNNLIWTSLDTLPNTFENKYKWIFQSKSSSTSAIDVNVVIRPFSNRLRILNLDDDSDLKLIEDTVCSFSTHSNSLPITFWNIYKNERQTISGTTRNWLGIRAYTKESLGLTSDPLPDNMKKYVFTHFGTSKSYTLLLTKTTTSSTKVELITDDTISTLSSSPLVIPYTSGKEFRIIMISSNSRIKFLNNAGTEISITNAINDLNSLSVDKITGTFCGCYEVTNNNPILTTLANNNKISYDDCAIRDTNTNFFSLENYQINNTTITGECRTGSTFTINTANIQYYTDANLPFASLPSMQDNSKTICRLDTNTNKWYGAGTNASSLYSKNGTCPTPLDPEQVPKPLCDPYIIQFKATVNNNTLSLVYRDQPLTDFVISKISDFSKEYYIRQFSLNAYMIKGSSTNNMIIASTGVPTGFIIKNNGSGNYFIVSSDITENLFLKNTNLFTKIEHNKSLTFISNEIDHLWKIIHFPFPDVLLSTTTTPKKLKLKSHVLYLYQTITYGTGGRDFYIEKQSSNSDLYLIYIINGASTQYLCKENNNASFKTGGNSGRNGLWKILTINNMLDNRCYHIVHNDSGLYLDGEHVTSPIPASGVLCGLLQETRSGNNFLIFLQRTQGICNISSVDINAFYDKCLRTGGPIWDFEVNGTETSTCSNNDYCDVSESNGGCKVKIWRPILVYLGFRRATTNDIFVGRYCFLHPEHMTMNFSNVGLVYDFIVFMVGYSVRIDFDIIKNSVTTSGYITFDSNSTSVKDLPTSEHSKIESFHNTLKMSIGDSTDQIDVMPIRRFEFKEHANVLETIKIASADSGDSYNMKKITITRATNYKPDGT